MPHLLWRSGYQNGAIRLTRRLLVWTACDIISALSFRRALTAGVVHMCNLRRIFPVALIQLALLQPTEVRADDADLIVHHGKIVTVDEKFSIAEALAVKGDRIVAVGTN